MVVSGGGVYSGNTVDTVGILRGGRVGRVGGGLCIFVTID